MTLAFENANSKLVEVADFDAEKHVDDNWYRFGHIAEFLFRLRAQGLIKILKLRFKRYFEAKVWSVFWC